MKKKAQTIEFEDRGQDYLEWDLDADGYILDSRPYRKDWIGDLVDLTSIQVGRPLRIHIIGATIVSKYPVIKITRHEI